MKTKINVMKKLTLFVAAFAFCAVLFKPVDVKAALAAPAQLAQIAADDDAVGVAWTEVSGAYQYGIQCSADPYFTGATESKTSSTSKNIYSLNSGTTYYVRVRTYSSYSASSYGPWSAILKVDTAPKNITWLKQTAAKETTVTYSWSPVTGATGYILYKALPTDAAWTTIGTTAATSYTLSVPKNSAYDVAVVPYRNVANAANLAAYPTSYPLDTRCVPLPTKPKSVKVISGGDPDLKEVRASWKATSASVNTDGFQVELHQLRTNGKTKKLKTFTTSSYYSYLDMKHSKLFTDACRFRVRAYVTIDGKKVYGAWSSYCTYVPQAKTTKLKFITKSTATLKWKKVNGAASYDIYYKTSASTSAKWKRIKKNVKGTSATVKANYYGRSYYYVKANKVKFGKKKLNSAAATKAPYWYYWY